MVRLERIVVVDRSPWQVCFWSAILERSGITVRPQTKPVHRFNQ
jgi:hypothetical protein